MIEILVQNKVTQRPFQKKKIIRPWVEIASKSPTIDKD